ncbi:MAG: Maf family protein [Slackia isoflavoniconvertens]|nr:Maf family protein [Slackia isoflavoniconvertens]
MPQKVEIILASGSPRRRELLEREGVSFTVLSADVDESLEPDLLRQPEEAAKKLAERKAGAIVQQVLGDPEYVGAAAIIGADTVVAANGKIYGKPVDEDDACRILGELSGRPHQVITGVSVWLVSAPPNKEVSLGFRTFAETSRVTFKELTDEVIAEYVAGGEPMDKAGAYGIQGDGRALVESIDGDFDNIVGLPVKRLMNEFSEIFEGAQ